MIEYKNNKIFASHITELYIKYYIYNVYGAYFGKDKRPNGEDSFYFWIDCFCVRDTIKF